MAQITGGRVVFSRTVQARQFEPVKAEVELSFTLAEGEDLEDTLVEISAVVKSQTMLLVQQQQNTTLGSGSRPAARRRSADED